MAETPKPSPVPDPKQAPESIKSDPAQAQRLASEGDTSRPSASEPVREDLPGNKASTAQLLGKAPPPEGGEVKQQDEKGRVIADEVKDREKILERAAEARVQADSATPQVLNAQSGTPATTESLQHDQLIARVRASSEPEPGQTTTPRPQTAVHIRTSAIRDKIKEKESQLRALDDEQGSRATTSRSMLQAQINELKEHEARATSGAPILMPRSRLLEAPEAIDKNADDHLRWVNEQAPGRADATLGMGYRKLRQEEGGRTVGELALYAIPREQHAKRTVDREQVQRNMLDKNEQDLQQLASEMAKYLRDVKGIKINERRLLVNERGGE